MGNEYQMTYAQQKAEIEKERAVYQQQVMLERAFSKVNTYINKDYLDVFSNAELMVDDQRKLCDISKLRMIELSKIVYDTEEDVLDKLSGVYNALYNLGVTVAIYIVGTTSETNFYFVTRSETIAPLAGDIMESMLKGNFPGVELRRIGQDEAQTILKSMEENEYGENNIKGLATVSAIPSVRDEEHKKEQFVQGLEKFIDTMQRKEYVAILLSSPLDKNAITNRKHGLAELYSTLSSHANQSIAYGENASIAVNKGVSKSFSESVNRSVSNSNSLSTSQTYGDTTTKSSSWGGGGSSSSEGSSSSWNYNNSTSQSSSSSYTSGNTFTSSISNSVGITDTETVNVGKTDTIGNSVTYTLNYENKGVSELLRKIEEQLQRINNWDSFGLWECCCYFFSKDIATSVLAATTYKALMTGEGSGVENAHVNIWQNRIERQRLNVKQIFNSTKYLMHPKAIIKETEGLKNQIVSPTSLVGGNELPILMSLPRKSVKGVSVIEMAEFGRNVIYENYLPKRSICIGNIYHMGIEEDSKVEMNLDLFSSHCFITGSSGSGKSYATYNLLDALLKKGIKMLVIEPAKGEYKQVFGKLNRVQIFTTSQETYKLLKINPFQFPKEIHILSHIEQVLQIFNASWPLYAAMPAILKEAVVKAYIKCGWDIQNSIWIEQENGQKFPVFQDVLDVLPKIINTSDYSENSKGDYKGALLTRVQSMTTGIAGALFKKSEGISDSVLFDNNTIIDLSEAGSEETIALLMGILIMKLNEYRKSQRKNNVDSGHDSKFHHVTVLEEAHNLLKRTSKDQNQEGANMVGKSVEMISNSIKEMRTYGEGFIIIDQSPLAIDSSAVENTATKIIMNTPSKEACDELGSALALREEQTKELSRLNVGVAAVMQKGWMLPVLMKVKGDWKMSDYEAPLQTAVPGILKFIRGKIIEELLMQAQEQKFSIRKVSAIIRNAETLVNMDKEDWSLVKWFQDQKSELEEVINLYKKYQSESVELTDKMIGHLIVETLKCEQLFELIPLGYLADGSSFYEEWEKKNKKEKEEYISKIENDVNIWAKKFFDALKEYVTLSKSDLSLLILQYELKIKIDNFDISNPFFLVNMVVQNMKLKNENEDEEVI